MNTNLHVITHLILISTLWYVTKSIITGYGAGSKKPIRFLIAYSIYTLGLAAGSLWIYTTTENSYLLILSAYAAAAGISAWIFKFHHARKAAYSGA